MQIQQITKNFNDNRTSFKAGLYFAKSPYILFNKKTPISYFANEKFVYNFYNSKILTSNEGFRYIEDDIISSDMKKEIANMPIIKELSEKFDTFVVSYKPKFIKELKKYSSLVDIFWADHSKEQAQNKLVIGYSEKSELGAVSDMLRKLSIREFAELDL